MKRIEYDLDHFFDTILNRPFRTKYDIINFILRLTKLIVIGYEGEVLLGKAIVYVDKMSRIIISYKNKLFSISYPFTVTVENNKIISIHDSVSGAKIDSKMISALLNYLDSDYLDRDIEDTFYDLLDTIDEDEYNTNDFWTIVRNLYMFESGYVRYDYDIDNENGRLHPLHHLDVNYSTKATYKIGLSKSISNEDLLGILDTETECYFIEDD